MKKCQPLVQQLFEICDRSTLEEHVPVGAHMALWALIGNGEVWSPRNDLGLLPAAAGPGKGDVLGLNGERNDGVVPLRAVVPHHLSLSEGQMCVIFVAHGTESAPAHRRFDHQLAPFV